MNKKTIITSILLIVLCLSLISGSTYALFTSESKINIAVTSGKVDVRANISIFALYSAEAEQTGVDENGKKLFANGGKAYQDMQGVLNLERMSPGDKVSVVLSVANYSDISAKYRLKFEVPEGGEKLASVLVTTIGTTSYTGLSKYRSPWQDIQIGQNPVYNFTIEMPMDAGNEYQGLSSNMVITVEAVQGNASTNDELLIETFALQTSSKTITLTNGNATVNTSISPSEEKHATTVVFNNVGINGQAALGVSTSGLVANIDKSFVVSETTVNNVVGTISFDLSQNETPPVTTFISGYAKVSTYITKGLSNVGVIYTGVDTYKFGKKNPGVKKVSEEQVQSPGDYYYNPDTGLLVFITDHFSEFLITSDSAKVYVPELFKVFNSLNDAITACEDGYTVILLKDITLLTDDDRLYPSKSVTIKGKKISFDVSDNNNFESYPIYVYNLPFAKTLTIEDITISGKAGDITLGSEYSNICLNNVKINSVGNTGFLQKFGGTATLNNVTIENTGYNSGETATNKDTAIAASLGGNIVINGGTYSSEHGYAVYVFSSGGTITINDGKFDGKICANIDRTTLDNIESHIIINGGEFKNVDFKIVNIINNEESIVSNNDLGNNHLGYVTIEIKGGKFDTDPTAYVDLTKYDVTNTSGIWVVTLKNQVNP